MGRMINIKGGYKMLGELRDALMLVSVIAELDSKYKKLAASAIKYFEKRDADDYMSYSQIGAAIRIMLVRIEWDEMFKDMTAIEIVRYIKANYTKEDYKTKFGIRHHLTIKVAIENMCVISDDSMFDILSIAKEKSKIMDIL